MNTRISIDWCTVVIHGASLVKIGLSKAIFASKFSVRHLLDETESNVRFVLPRKVMLGKANLSLTSLDPGKADLMLDKVEFNKCFIIPKQTLGSSQF